MPTILITGANRGLGLEFTKQYAADGWRVHACCRYPDTAEALQGLAASDQVSVHRLDVTDPATIEALAAEIDGPIDVLLNNAGTFRDRRGFGNSDYDAWLETFKVNVLGPMRVAEAFVDHVARSERKVIANVTSKMGSIADNTSGGCVSYRSTKAALNMATKSMSLDLAGRGICAVVLHPGWVQTDMGGMSAPLETQPSIAGMRKVIGGLGPGDSGRFFNYDGAEIPW